MMNEYEVYYQLEDGRKLLVGILAGRKAEDVKEAVLKQTSGMDPKMLTIKWIHPLDRKAAL